jgi:glutamine amidotransferase
MVTVSVVAYGIGNVQSMVNALRRVGAEVHLAESGAELEAQRPQRIVMPGVGAAGAALQNLRERGLEMALRNTVLKGGVPLIGVCVGMQVLFETCEEFGRHEGFGWIPGKVARLAPEGDPLRLPHVGWNNIEAVQPDPLLEDAVDRDFYFLHSYAAACPDEFVIATAEYGRRFCAAIRKDHVVAVQFHPEKSSGSGERLLANFLRQ